jgi:hypothetical protein
MLAAERATLVLQSGERISGELIDMNASGFHIRVNDETRTIEANRVAMIEFEGAAASPAAEARARSGQPTVVLKNGQTVDGRLVDIGGTSPLRLTVEASGGTRDISSAEVARVYIATGSATSGAVATTGNVNTITVPANTQWTSTNVQVKDGERVDFAVSGAVRFSPNEADWSQPAGQKTQKMGPGAPLQTAPKGALLGRIDNGQPFYIGDQRSVRMPASGTLHLGVNDDLVSDNSGEYHVSVTKR